ncbi:hypothetical protein NUSPORA_00212 [Nucleospora cyclopteri]
MLKKGFFAIISNVTAATYYTVQLMSEPTKFLCLSQKDAGFRDIKAIEDLSNDCKFYYDESKLVNMSRKYLCRESGSGNFHGCLTKSAPNTLLSFLRTQNNSFVIKQANYVMSFGEYDADRSHYKLIGLIQKPNINIEDKLLIRKYKRDTNEQVNLAQGNLEDNKLYSGF